MPTGLKHRLLVVIAVAVLMILLVGLLPAGAQTQEPQGEKKGQPGISLSEEMGDAMVQQAERVRDQIKRRAVSLFERKPLGWNWRTIEYIYKWLLNLPLQIPRFIQRIIEQSRLLGAVGSAVVFIFLVALLYSVFGQKRIMRRIVARVEPYQEKIPETIYPFILSAVRVVVATLFPLVLLGLFSLINALIDFKADWFQFIGKLLIIWSGGALLIRLLCETLTRDLFSVTAEYGKTIYRLSRLAVLYAMFGVALFWGAKIFHLRPDVLALLKFVVSASIVLVLFLLLLKKKALLSFLPQLPYATYQGFVRLLSRYYYPLIFFSFILAVLWCFGYRDLGRVVLVKIWSSAAAYLAIMGVYHGASSWLKRWYTRTDAGDETAQLLYRAFRTLLVYLTIIAVVLIVFNLVGLLGLLREVMSFPVFQLGEKSVTFWIILQALLILLAFIFASRLIQAYLDYQVYPKIGIEPGLGYALNTSIKYASWAIGAIFSLKIVGLDLQFLLVFAGAAGIGIGLGLQNMAANVIAGFSLIFGGKIRKGDWVEVSGTLGLVTDIYLRATKVRTRDNIEYLIPNAEFIATTIVNYSLSSPEIRLAVPVGVSYDADPKAVAQILLTVAEKEPLVSKNQEPVVRFVEYGDSSINFELLVWMDVRTTARRRIRSALYFAIFGELKKAGIEIPFPQRDLHFRSGFETIPKLEPRNPAEEG